MSGSTQPGVDEPLPRYLDLLRRLFDSFRREVSRCLKDKTERVIARAEERVRSRGSGLDLTFSDPKSVLSVLDLIETIPDEAPIFNRARLRSTALRLVSELYRGHYALLEQFQAIDALERFYCRVVKPR